MAVCAVITAAAAVAGVWLLLAIKESVETSEATLEAVETEGVAVIVPRDAALAVSCKNSVAHPGLYDVAVQAIHGGIEHDIKDGTYSGAEAEAVARRVLAYYDHNTLGGHLGTLDCWHLDGWRPQR